MYKLVVIGCTVTVYALTKLWQYISKEEGHVTVGGVYSQRGPPPGSPSGNTSDGNSGCENNDPLFQSDRTQTRYYDYCPNLPTSSSITKRHSHVPLQSESSNKSMGETARSVENLERLKNFSKPKPSVPKHASASSSSKPIQSPTEPPPSSSDQPRSSDEVIQSSPLPFNPTNHQTKANYTVNQKDDSSVLKKIPKDIESLIKKNIVPNVLKKPLSPSTYKDYFAALLYAEDFYIEKWSNFLLLDVTLEVHEATIHDKLLKNNNLKKIDRKNEKTIVSFEIDAVPEKRPFILPGDFVHAGHSGSKAKLFQGIVYRVVKSTKVLVEFEKKFYSQHQPKNRYDISFSFNRAHLKFAHQAIAAASNPSFRNYLFPDSASRMNIPSRAPLIYSNLQIDSNSKSAIHQILKSEGQPPYLIEGPLCVTDDELSKTGLVVREAVCNIHKRLTKCRILVCAPMNITGDMLLRSLEEEIPESDMFRANDAFRDVDGGVSDDILPPELKQFKVIFTTFVSSFLLHRHGIPAGHFSHIFLLDASSVTEPETMIPLANLANDNTTVIVTGARGGDCTRWVRSDIARKNYGLRMSYFERLRATKTYSNSDPMFITAV